jgi:hypothetical protein
LSLSQLSDDSIQLFQTLIPRQRVQDEVETSEHHVQPHLDSNPQQLQLPNLQPNTRALVIVLNVETMFIRGHQVVFERYFKNTNEGQMMSRFSNEVSHRL